MLWTAHIKERKLQDIIKTKSFSGKELKEQWREGKVIHKVKRSNGTFVKRSEEVKVVWKKHFQYRINESIIGRVEAINMGI